MCEPECQNGAPCVSNDVCNCPIHYTGSRCEIGKKKMHNALIDIVDIH